MDAIKRVFFYPSVGKCDAYDFFQVLQVFQCGIVLASDGRFQPILEIANKLPVQFIQEQVILVISKTDKLPQPVYGSLKFCHG